MPEYLLDNLFREYGNDRPYYGSWEWFQETQIARRERELCQEEQQREKYAKEETIRAKWVQKDYPFGSR